ncbi:MAG: hypothetical protein HYT87_03855 [Nitrospirae bacterium]|nr:hypothetical protein [Nitrospirota bacterium]
MNPFRILVLPLCVFGLAACELPLATDEGPKGVEGQAKNIEQSVQPAVLTKASDAYRWLEPLPVDLAGKFDATEAREEWDSAFKAEAANMMLNLPGIDLGEVETAINKFDSKGATGNSQTGKDGTPTTGGTCPSGQKAVQLGAKCRELFAKMCACPGSVTNPSLSSTCQYADKGMLCSDQAALMMSDEESCSGILTEYGSQLCSIITGTTTPSKSPRRSPFFQTSPGGTTTPPPPPPPPTGTTTGSTGGASTGSSTGSSSGASTGGKTGTTTAAAESCPKVTDRSDSAAGLLDITITGGCSRSLGKSEKISVDGEAVLKGKVSAEAVDLTMTIVQPLDVKSPNLSYRAEGSAFIRGQRSADSSIRLIEAEMNLWAQITGFSERLPLSVGSLKIETKAGETTLKGTASYTWLDPNRSENPEYGAPGWRAGLMTASYDDLRIREGGADTITYNGGLVVARSYKGGEPTKPPKDEPTVGRVEAHLKEVVRGTACDQEPLSGTIELRGKETLSIAYDGAEKCDGRSPVTFKGETQSTCVVEHCKPTFGEAVAALPDSAAATKTSSTADSELMQTLSGATEEELKADANGNGKPDAEDLLRYLETRVASAYQDRPVSGGTRSNTELLLQKLGTISPDALDRARFLQVIYDLAQFLGPMADLAQIFSFGSQTATSLDINSVMGPLIGIISPDTPCAERGLAQCGKDLADSIAAMGVNINAPAGYRLVTTKVVFSKTTHDLGGVYNEAAFRFLAAIGQGVHAGLYFAAAHVDINSLLSEATSLLSGSLSFDVDTAGQILTTIDQLDGMMLKILEGAVKNTGAASKLETSRASAKAAIEWIHGNAGSKPAVVSALENSTSAEAVLRFVDSNGDNRLNACDEIVIRFFPESFGAFAATGAGSILAEGCPAPSSAAAFRLPKTEGGLAIDYSALWPAQAALLTKLGKAVVDPSVGVSSRELAIGSPTLTAVLGDAFQVYPGVLFQSGLSALTPATSGSGSLLKLKIEAEVSSDAAACPDGKTKDGALICKNKKGDKDQSALISRGDAAHFAGAMAKDNLLINEALLDSVGAAADSPYRAAQGGGYLLYLQFKDPALKGLVKVSDRLIGELTDSSRAVCSRSIGTLPSAGYVASDDRVLNALMNWLTVQVDICGKKGLFGNFLDFDQTGSLFALAP